jgi:PBP1b-binding outer membrane lipoprotein LpoB
MVSMKRVLIIICLALLVSACTREEPAPWEGPELSQPRNQLTVEELQQNRFLPLADMSYFAKPEWAGEAVHSFSGSISFENTRMIYHYYSIYGRI